MMNVDFGASALSPATSKLDKLKHEISSTEGDVLEIAHALFSRAPAEFVEYSSVESIKRISTRALTCYQRFLSGEKSFLVEVENLSDPYGQEVCTGIFTAISDRPFIIDSLTETLANLGLHHHVLLHPILNTETDSTSLVYIELPLIRDLQVHQTILERISQVFSHLLLVTDDFNAMLTRCQEYANTLKQEASVPNNKAREAVLSEISAFLDWIADGNFVFLGHRVWDGSEAHPTPLPESELGYFRSQQPKVVASLADFRRDAELLVQDELIIHCSKSLLVSDVHKQAPIDSITISLPSTEATNGPTFAVFIGMFTSKAAAQSTLSVPLIREKVQSILEREGLLPNTHDYKEVISIADNIAKDDLLRFPIERFRQEISLIFDLQRRDEVRVSSFLLPLHRFFSVNVVVPRGRFSREMRQRIQRFLERMLGVADDSSLYHLTFTDYPLVVLRLLIPNESLEPVLLDLAECESAIQEMTLTWDDRLRQELGTQLDEHDAEELYRAYRNVFPEEYKALTPPEEALSDISCIANLSESRQLDVSLNRVRGGGRSYELKLFRWGMRFTLSGIIPYLENIGFEVEDEVVTSLITPRGDWAGIYNLRVYPHGDIELDPQSIRQNILPGIRQIFASEVENDRLNQLLLDPGLHTRQIALLRTLLNYLWQIKATASRGSAIEALTKNRALAKTIVQLFEARFNPATVEREAEVTRLDEVFHQEIKEVPRLIHDRTLRALRNAVFATQRTNYFQPHSQFRISLKIHCADILTMPSPRPLVEIFVNAPFVEGVHLRGGRVARGGLRWSERKEDYRTEVLGLMKTQMVKNSIIVPVGAKGGFLVKKSSKAGSITREDVERAYLDFIRSLLEITDNVVDGVHTPPEQVVCYDEPDPYLVVAADRGTATFSDIANKLAQEEFQFWMADAFASGGSNGYDHKKLGITARGAWESVTRHFREIGLDIDSQAFTAVGIGDMSGDVFGNGMLLSENIKVVAAFNHQHIFIDPNPDPATSYQERLRLFNVPHSQWTDYDSSLLSEGGGVFERSQKEIVISEQASTALGITERTLSGEALIRAILCAPVDLLWNGGIGTYIKSAAEENLQVSDRANDDVRVDARNLRAKVIGEGGNLGLTQKARIEYSKIGGHLNTDAVDNSGGVDLSDLEVNIKILLSQPVKRGELSETERNALLEELAEECQQRIVARNRTQSRVISLSVRRSRKNLGYYRGLLSTLEAEGVLDRQAEELPDDETLEKRMSLRAGLTRPELSVLLAYTRMTLKENLLASNLLDEPFLQHFALNYFPVSLRERFSEDILQHPLRHEIIATQVINLLLERMGASFVYRTAEETGAATPEIVSAFLVASEILDAYGLTIDLHVLDKTSTSRLYLNTLIKISNALDGMTRWMLETRSPDLNLTQVASLYKPAFSALMLETKSLLTPTEANRFDEACKQLLVHGIGKDLARRLTALSFASAYLDVVEIARTTGHDPLGVARLYSQVSITTQVRELLDRGAELEPADRWEALALRSVLIELRRSIAQTTALILRTHHDTTQEVLEEFLQQRSETFDRYRASVRESHNKPLTIAIMLVIANQLAALHRH